MGDTPAATATTPESVTPWPVPSKLVRIRDIQSPLGLSTGRSSTRESLVNPAKCHCRGTGVVQT
jgi:hypothetical protein